MTPLQQAFETWCDRSEWSFMLSTEKNFEGAYVETVTQIAFESWLSSQAHVIDMIMKTDEVMA